MTAEQLTVVGHKLIAAGLLVDGPLRVKSSRVGCLGACGCDPVMCVQSDGVWYFGVTQADLDRVIAEHLVGGRVVDDLVFHRGPGPSLPSS
jgi:(2Fe-2S) ferredoxin